MSSEDKPNENSKLIENVAKGLEDMTRFIRTMPQKPVEQIVLRNGIVAPINELPPDQKGAWHNKTNKYYTDPTDTWDYNPDIFYFKWFNKSTKTFFFEHVYFYSDNAQTLERVAFDIKINGKQIFPTAHHGHVSVADKDHVEPDSVANFGASQQYTAIPVADFCFPVPPQTAFELVFYQAYDLNNRIDDAEVSSLIKLSRYE